MSRGSGGGSSGGMSDMILKIAPIGCSFIAFLFMAIALSSAIKPNYIEGINIINVSPPLPVLNQQNCG
jgi:hypothetical protein